MPHSLAETAKKFGKTEAQTSQILNDAKQKLFTQRSLRPPPPVDTKIITSWNVLSRRKCRDRWLSRRLRVPDTGSSRPVRSVATCDCSPGQSSFSRRRTV